MDINNSDSLRFGGGGRPPIGKKWSLTGELVDHEEEQNLISKVRILREAGHSQNTIARILSDEGYTNRVGGQLQRHNILYILQKIKEDEERRIALA